MRNAGFMSLSLHDTTPVCSTMRHIFGLILFVLIYSSSWLGVVSTSKCLPLKGAFPAGLTSALRDLGVLGARPSNVKLHPERDYVRCSSGEVYCCTINNTRTCCITFRPPRSHVPQSKTLTFRQYCLRERSAYQPLASPAVFPASQKHLTCLKKPHLINSVICFVTHHVVWRVRRSRQVTFGRSRARLIEGFPCLCFLILTLHSNPTAPHCALCFLYSSLI